MKTKNISDAELDTINPDHIAVATATAEDPGEVLTLSGTEIIKIFKDANSPNRWDLRSALDWWLNDKSGNSFDIIVWFNGELCKANFG